MLYSLGFVVVWYVVFGGVLGWGVCFVVVFVVWFWYMLVLVLLLDMILLITMMLFVVFEL